MNRNVEKSLLDIDFASLTRGPFTPSPAAWEDQVLYFLMLDRFSEGNENGGHADVSGRPVQTGATPLYCAQYEGRIDYDSWVRAGAGWQGGTIKGLTSKLGYLRRLGITAVWVSPPFRQVAFEASYHGYGVQNFLDIDPHFGTREEFRDFVRAAHEQGIYVILDIVAHHTGNVFTYDADRYPAHDASGCYFNDPRGDGRPYEVVGFNDDKGQPTLAFGTSGELSAADAARLEASWPDGAIWPREFQQAGLFLRKGRINNWGHHPEYVEGDMADGLKTLDVRVRWAGQYRRPSPAMAWLCLAYSFWIAYADLDGFRIDAAKHMDADALRSFCDWIREFSQSIGKDRFLLVGEVPGSLEHARQVVESTGLDAALGIEDIPGKLERMTTGEADPIDYFSLFRNWQLDEPDGCKHRWYRDQLVTLVDDHDQVRKWTAKRRFCGDSRYRDLAFNVMAVQLTTVGIPCLYYGSEQGFDSGGRTSDCDNWLRRPDPWEVARLPEAVEIPLASLIELHNGILEVIPGRPSSLIGIPYDRPVVGYGGKTINTLRLWAAAAPDYFDFQRFSSGDFVGALADTLGAASLTRVLYPDDSTSVGKRLRFVQEYFLVTCSLADLVRRFQRGQNDWAALPEKVAIQLNDTHPALAVPELMRILLDKAKLGWDHAWDLTQRTLAYTNHTLLPEALEKWPLDWFEPIIPRNLEIIYEINRRLVTDVRSRYPGDEPRVARMSLIEEGPVRKVRMANLAIVGSHSTNGVAAIHSELLRATTVPDLAAMFPERFNNKTNGVTPRRWLLQCNPALAKTITGAIGDGWITDLTQLAGLKPLAEDKGFRDAFRNAKRQAKTQFADWLRATAGLRVDPDTIFDCQIKRIHEYKRQLLNALRIVMLYNHLRANPQLDMPPRTFFFAGKAAPAYHLAKVIIKFINNLADTIGGDPAVRGRMKVVFLPDYRVTLAERLIPASDVSNQISTAGFEASGTSNMKFMMNGALTIGTRDGATIEMAEEAGEENFFLFGLTADQVAGSRAWYSPWWHYHNEPETRAALDLIFSDHFSRDEPGIFEPLRATLLGTGDHYMHLGRAQK